MSGLEFVSHSLAAAMLVAAIALISPAAAQDGETVTVVGTLTDEGVECPAMQGDDGQLYTLTRGSTDGFEIGDRVRVTGTQVMISFCMQGITIGVESIEPAE